MDKQTIKYIILILIGILMSLSTFAQQNFYKYRLGITGGTMLYYGDLTDGLPRVKQYTEWAKGLTLDKSLSRASSIRLSYSEGQIRYNDRTRNWSGDFVENNSNFNRALNFETDIKDVSFSFVFHADNNNMIDDRAFFSPYFTVGIGATHYQVHGDLLDANGEIYNFEANPFLMQDNNFETNLQDLDIEGTDYGDIALHIPIGFGLKFRLSDRINLNLETNIKYTLTDYLDDVDKRGKDDSWNDVYAYTHASLNYNFGYKEKGYRPPVIVVAPQVYTMDATDINYLMAMEVLTDSIPQNIEVPLSKREQKLADKQAKKEQKLAAKEAKKRCQQACQELPKAEQAACKENCATEEGYTAYLKELEMETVQSETYIDSLQNSFTTTNQYQENIDSLQQIIEIEEKERIDSGTLTIETPDAMMEMPITPSTEDTISVEEKVEVIGGSMTAMENAALLQSILQMQQQIIALQQQLGQISQQPRSNTGYDPVVEMYKMETDRLRQESSDAKIIGEIQLLRKEIENLKAGSLSPTTNDNGNTMNGNGTAMPDNTSRSNRNMVVPNSAPKSVEIQKAEKIVVETVKENSTEQQASNNQQVADLQKQLEELQQKNGDLLKKVMKQNEELIKEQRKATKASKKREKATEDLNETIKDIRQEEIEENLKKEEDEENLKKDN
ncbi:MAG: hypothetical protein R3E32_19505 [Chitinophagales bacterium]